MDYKEFSWRIDACIMTLIINTTQRANIPEIMDDLTLGGPVLNDTLNKLGLINKWLGGNAVTIDGLKKLLAPLPTTKKISIIDLGCGGGDTLRQVAQFGEKAGYTFDLTGIDANNHVIDYAKSQATVNEKIKFVTCDIFSKEFETLDYDLVICSLFLHHFSDEQLVQLLSFMLLKASIGILVNDLHRNSIAYILFKALGLFISNEMVLKDGLTSIRRGFKHDELKELSEKIKSNYAISWKWAFRYQWLIQKQ